MSENAEISGSSKENPLQEFEEYEKLLTKLEENNRKSTRRMYLFFCLIFLVFVAVIGLSLVFIDSSFISELRSGNSSLMKNTDYLEIVIPILIAIVAAFIAFLGMNRLRDMDEQMDQMRNSIDIELDKEMKRVADLRNDLAVQINVAVKDGLSAEMQKSTEESKKQIEEKENSALTAIQEEMEAFSAVKGTAEKLQRALEEKYGFIFASVGEPGAGKEDYDIQSKISDKDASAATKRETEKQIAALLRKVGSVYDAHKAVEALWSVSDSDKPDNIVELTQRYVEKVVSSDSTLRGDADDYHNLAAECARHSFYQLSCDVCQKGLDYFPDDIDLLADWVKYGTKLGNIQAVQTGPLLRLLTIDKTYWNWRAFDFTVDYYLETKKFDAAEQLAEDFIRYLPYEERAYRSLADVREQKYAKEEGTEKVIEALQRATNQDIACPLCANRLAEILCDCGRLEEALDSANRALRDLSQEQPSINYGYVIYRRGLIQDRLAFQMQEAGDENARHIAQRAALDYQVAVSSHWLSAITERQAKVRYSLLKIYFDLDDDGS